MKSIYICDNDYFKWNYNGNAYILHIHQDSDSEDPRQFCDHDTLMACFHRRYNLGDTIDQSEPEDFWKSLVAKYVPSETLTEKALAGKLDGIRLEETSPDVYNVYEMDDWGCPKGGRKEYLQYANVPKANIADYLTDDLTIPQCQSLLYSRLVSLPLWLYDHSGITISCGDREYPYNDRWDSSAVGWIVYAKQKNDDEDWREKAFARMRAEVKEYDQYLQGEVYGITLYENGREVNNCWDFYGDDLTQNGILYDCPGLTEALESGAYETGQARRETTVTYYFD